MVSICSISDSLREELNAFSQSSGLNSAIVLKIDPSGTNCKVVDDESYDDITVEELQEELPEHLPRYVVYKNGDGLMCFIFISPSGTKPELQVGSSMYSLSV